MDYRVDRNGANLICASVNQQLLDQEDIEQSFSEQGKMLQCEDPGVDPRVDPGVELFRMLLCWE